MEAKTVTVKFTLDEAYAIYKSHSMPGYLNGYEQVMLVAAHNKVDRALEESR